MLEKRWGNVHHPVQPSHRCVQVVAGRRVPCLSSIYTTVDQMRDGGRKSSRDNNSFIDVEIFLFFFLSRFLFPFVLPFSFSYVTAVIYY